MSDFSDFKQSYAGHIAALTEANARNKLRLFEALSAAGITSVTVSFDGEGDTGQLGTITAYAGEAPRELPPTPLTLEHVLWGAEPVQSVEAATLHDAVEVLCYAYLSQEHGGWETNDGAFGDFTFDVAEGVIDLEFHQRIVDCYTTDSSF